MNEEELKKLKVKIDTPLSKEERKKIIRDLRKKFRKKVKID